MNAKESEANQNYARTIRNDIDSVAPPSYDEVICTQQSLIYGRDDGREFVQQQSIRMESFQDSHIYGQMFTIRPLVGLYSENLICPFCQDRVNTRVEYVTTPKTHFSAMICCAICWPCGWCPYLMKECHDAHHYCPKCKAFIGVHSP